MFVLGTTSMFGPGNEDVSRAEGSAGNTNLYRMK